MSPIWSRIVAVIFLLAISSRAHAQFVSPAGGVCSVAGARKDIAERYRATAFDGNAFEVDSILACAVRIGPFQSACIGTYVPTSTGSEIIIIGRDAAGEPPTGILWLPDVTARSVTITNNALTLAFNAFAQNSFAGYPWLVDDEDGARIAPREVVKVCGGAAPTGVPEATEENVAATGAAGTKRCLCERLSSGTFRWRNLLNPADLTGTTTTCPDSL